MLRAFALVTLIEVTACQSDETVSAYGAETYQWQLSMLDGQPWRHTATLEFDGEDVSGQAPCNRFFAKQTLPYPWFALESFGATKMACPDSAAETIYLDALSEMTQVEVVADVLLLTDDAGREMVFKPAKSGG